MMIGDDDDGDSDSDDGGVQSRVLDSILILILLFPRLRTDLP